MSATERATGASQRPAATPAAPAITDASERAAIAWSYTAPLRWTADEQRRAVAGLLKGYAAHAKGAG